MIITGGKYKGRKVQVPDEKITRPTLSKVRQGVFNTLFSLVGDFENLLFLDLFGGSGIMGLEALSRGFKGVLVFEKNVKVAQILKKNYAILGLKTNLNIGDSLKLLDKIEQNYDVIFVDPPYYSGVYLDVFTKLYNIIGENTIIIAEHNEPLELEHFRLLKEKKYGDKFVTFWKKLSIA